MRRKVIYVSFGRLTDKVSRDWYIDYLIEKGVTVEYWDVVALMREEHAERGAKTPDYLHVLKEFSDLEELLRSPSNRDAMYVMLVNYTGRFTRIYRLFSKYDCKMLFIAWGAMPSQPELLWRRLANAISRPIASVRIISDMLKARALRSLKLVKRFDIVFAAGKVLMATEHHAMRKVPINLCDYDHYARVKNANVRLVDARYAVFLDINLPHQSDLLFCGYPQVDAASYYRSLNRFFGILERERGLKVVVAAHPKANYDATTFEGRQINRLVTAELVRDAELVLSHTSTALSYAVLNVKPLLFIYTDQMLDAYRSSVIREMQCYAERLDASILNIDHIDGAEKIFVRDANSSKYEEFKYSFLTTSDSEHEATQDIFLREITALDRKAGDDRRVVGGN